MEKMSAEIDIILKFRIFGMNQLLKEYYGTVRSALGLKDTGKAASRLSTGNKVTLSLNSKIDGNHSHGLLTLGDSRSGFPCKEPHAPVKAMIRS